MSSDTDPKRGGIARIVRPRWRGAVFICGKCLKRHQDGKILRRALKTEVKAHAPVTGHGKAKIVKTACVGLCPRGAVVLASAATLSVGEIMLVRDVGEIANAVPSLLP